VTLFEGLSQPQLAEFTHFAARILSAIYLVGMMFSIGLELGAQPTEDAQAKRRKRRLLVLGLAFNLLLLPLVGVVLCRVVHASGDVAAGFLVLLSCPGGRFAPMLSRAAGADLGLSVELTLFLAKLVSFTAPVTARWMLAGERAEIHELAFILQLLALQLLPYLLGRWLRPRHVELAARLARPIRVLTISCAFFLFGLVLLNHDLRGVELLPWDRGWLAALLFAPIGIGLGWLLGGREPRTKGAFVLSVTSRDLALSLVIVHFTFADRDVPLATFLIWFGYFAIGGLFALVFRGLLKPLRRGIPTLSHRSPH
jgi:predicted Na+-dependent transporter